MEKQYKPLSEIVGENVKRLIKETKYRTQEDFAYAYGVETRTLSRWLNKGINNIDTLEIMKNRKEKTICIIWLKGIGAVKKIRRLNG